MCGWDAKSEFLSSRLKVPSIYVIFLGGTLQIIRFALLATLHETLAIERKVSGYKFIAGKGCTVSFAMALMLIDFTAETRNRDIEAFRTIQLQTDHTL